MSRAAGAVRTKAATRSSLTIDNAHNAVAAVSGTETLSSRRIGTVSTAAATTAAAIGAPSENHKYGGGTISGRHHQHRNDPAAPPATTSAALPAALLCRFHGHLCFP